MNRPPLILAYWRGEETWHHLGEADGALAFTDPAGDGPRPGLRRLVEEATEHAGVMAVTVQVLALEDLGRSLGQVVHNLTSLVGAGVVVRVGGGEPVWLYERRCGAQPPPGAGGPAAAAQVLDLLDRVRRDGASRRAQRGVAGARERGQRLGAPRLLTQEQVRWAADRVEEGMSFAGVASDLGVSGQTVARAVRALTGDERGVPHPGTEAPTHDATQSTRPRTDPRPDESGRTLH